LPTAETAARIAAGEIYAMRLDAAKAADRTGPLVWAEQSEGPTPVDPLLFGDVVLARKDIRTSYHLSVVVDDSLQGVTLVTRGRDLYAATHIHRTLQALLGLAVPVYRHHPLIVDLAGQRLAKRHDALAIRALREAGNTPADIRAKVASAL
jgi:glutamyl-Q tRNA(Asp) synthetase